MTIRELFAINKETLFGQPPEDPMAALGYNAVIRQVGYLVDQASRQLLESGSLSSDIQTLVRLNRNFHQLDGIKAICEVDPGVESVIEESQKIFCGHFDQVYQALDLKVA